MRKESLYLLNFREINIFFNKTKDSFNKERNFCDENHTNL